MRDVVGMQCAEKKKKRSGCRSGKDAYRACRAEKKCTYVRKKVKKGSGRGEGVTKSSKTIETGAPEERASTSLWEGSFGCREGKRRHGH